MTTKVSDERLRELIRWDERTCIDKVPGGFAFDHIAALRELQEKRALLKECEIEVQWARKFIELARYELADSKAVLGDQFPHKDDATSVMQRLDALLARVRGETT